MKASRKQTKLNKASRCVIRRIEQGHAHLVGTISQAARRFRVKAARPLAAHSVGGELGRSK